MGGPSGGENAFDNFFDSSNTASPIRNPAWPNQLGFDADTYLVPNPANSVIKNGDTSATITLQTRSDRFMPGMLAFTTDLYAPIITLTKSATDINGGELRPGDELEYQVTGTNNDPLGNAYNSILTDGIPAGTTYVPGTIRVTANPDPAVVGGKTDNPNDDQGRFGGGVLTVHVGRGATSALGGLLKPGDTFTVTFRVKVEPGATDGQEILNVARLTSTDEAGRPYAALDSARSVVTITSPPDLTIFKRHTQAFARSEVGTFTLEVVNVGTRSTTAPVIVFDPMPTGLVLESTPTGPGWDCAASTPTDLSCTRADVLAPTRSYPLITLQVRVSADAPQTIVNVGIVTGGGDNNNFNNQGKDTVTLVYSQTTVKVWKRAFVRVARPGMTVRYRLYAKVTGSADAYGLKVCDDLPEGLTFISAPRARFRSGMACWTIDVARAGTTYTFEVRARVAKNHGAGKVRNFVIATSKNSRPTRGSTLITIRVAKPPTPRPPGVVG